MTLSVCDQVAERVALGEPLGDLTEHAEGCASCKNLIAMSSKLGATRHAVDPGLGFTARMTVGEWCATWLEGYSTRRASSVRQARVHLALIVAEFGKKDRKNGGLTLDPDKTERILKRTATDTPCPAQNPFVYPDGVAPPALCEGDAAFNGFYGEGIVNADRAVR